MALDDPSQGTHSRPPFFQSGRGQISPASTSRLDRFRARSSVLEDTSTRHKYRTAGRGCRTWRASSSVARLSAKSSRPCPVTSASHLSAVPELGPSPDPMAAHGRPRKSEAALEPCPVTSASDTTAKIGGHLCPRHASGTPRTRRAPPAGQPRESLTSSEAKQRANQYGLERPLS
jgi:hypothetical protein